ncbi:MAG: hypothetical protein QXD95_06140 [Nitrososphaeria archaeon]
MEIGIKSVCINSKVYEGLIELAKKYPSRIICGFIIGYKDNSSIFIDSFYLFPASTGPKIHFKPIWNGYYSAKEYINNYMRKEIVGEFHTHPDGNEELTNKDKQILKWLGTKIMIIVTPNKIIPIQYIGSKNKKFTHIINYVPVKII